MHAPLFPMRVARLGIVVAAIGVCLHANANFVKKSQIDEIINQNPQLTTVSELPRDVWWGSGDKCRTLNQFTTNVKTNGAMAGVTRDHVCLDGTLKSPAKAWEKAYGSARHFTLVLHPETPRVWRVYERLQNGVPKPIAEFDRSGKKTAWSAGPIAADPPPPRASSARTAIGPTAANPSEAAQPGVNDATKVVKGLFGR